VTSTAYVDTPADLRSLFAAELVLSGDLEWLTKRLMWRLAARKAASDLPEDLIAKQEQEFVQRQDLDSAELPAWLNHLGRDGELLAPMPNSDGFQVCRVIKKIEPDPQDDAVKQRVQQRVLDRHFGELTNKYVERRLGAVIAVE